MLILGIGGFIIAMGVRLAHGGTPTPKITYGSSLTVDLHPVLRPGRQTNPYRFSRSFIAIHLCRPRFPIIRAFTRIGCQQGERARSPCQELEVEPDRQDEQRGHEEQGLGRRGHYARRRLVCQVLEVTGQESRSLGIGRRGRGGLRRMHVGLWELCSGWVVRRTDQDVELAIGAGEEDLSSERGTCLGIGHGEGEEGEGREGQEVRERDYGTQHGCAEQCVDREYFGWVIEREPHECAFECMVMS